MIKVSVDDLFGRFFLRKKGAPSNRDGYYISLLAVEPLLRSEAWALNANHYINIDAKKKSVRVSYFVPQDKDVLPIVEAFVSNSDVEYAIPSNLPEAADVATSYGGEELRFRRFLSTYSHIGLDIMTADLVHAICLFVTFRFQIMAPRLPYRDHFESTFNRQSSFYREMEEIEKVSFWEDMTHWPNPPQVDWAHMFVNMVLGLDWPTFFQSPPMKPATLDETNNILRQCNMGFQIPHNWSSKIE